MIQKGTDPNCTTLAASLLGGAVSLFKLYLFEHKMLAGVIWKAEICSRNFSGWGEIPRPAV